jgi:hypothetical protein
MAARKFGEAVWDRAVLAVKAYSVFHVTFSYVCFATQVCRNKEHAKIASLDTLKVQQMLIFAQVQQHGLPSKDAAVLRCTAAAAALAAPAARLVPTRHNCHDC